MSLKTQNSIEEKILQAISKNQPLSYSQISKITGLSIWTISDIIQILAKHQIVSITPLAGAKLVRINNETRK